MYYQLRVTPSAFKCPFPLATKVCQMILKRQETETDMYIFGDEHLDKNGVETARHFHFNFCSDDKKDTLQKAIRVWFNEHEYVCKGNACYALAQVDEPNDIKRWLRYNMKERWVPSLSNLKDFTPDEIEYMENLAKDERQRQVLKNKEYHAKQQDKQTLFDKIIKHIEKKDLKTYRDIFIEIVRYYVEDKKPVCPRTVKGYTHNYMLSHQLISYEEFYELQN